MSLRSFLAFSNSAPSRMMANVRVTVPSGICLTKPALSAFVTIPAALDRRTRRTDGGRFSTTPLVRGFAEVFCGFFDCFFEELVVVFLAGFFVGMDYLFWVENGTH